MLLALNGWSPGMLLNILQRPGWRLRRDLSSQTLPCQGREAVVQKGHFYHGRNYQATMSYRSYIRKPKLPSAVY